MDRRHYRCPVRKARGKSKESLLAAERKLLQHAEEVIDWVEPDPVIGDGLAFSQVLALLGYNSTTWREAIQQRFDQRGLRRIVHERAADLGKQEAVA